MANNEIRENDRFEGNHWSAQVLAIATTRNGDTYIVYQEGDETKSAPVSEFRRMIRQNHAKKITRPKYQVGDTFITDDGYRVEILAVSPTISHKYGCYRYFCQVEFGDISGQYDYKSLSDVVLRNYQRVLV